MLSESGPDPAAGARRPIIAFRLDGEAHAFDLTHVEEVVVDRRPHPLPDMPAEMLGLLSLRGALIPVLDIAPRLGARLRTRGENGTIILNTPSGRVGIAVDGVDAVDGISPGSVRPAPGGGGDAKPYLLGIAHLDVTLLTLVDPIAILSGREPKPTKEQR